MERDQLAKVRAAVQKHLAGAIALSKALKDHPELPYREKESSRKLAECLRAGGFAVEYPFLSQKLGYDTAFRAVLENGEGPRIALLAEYDALPEIGHACGHNLHGALSVLAGLALAELRGEFQGSVYVIGTPAEEENGAKITMADEGVFDGMAMAAMIHSYSGASQADMDVLSLRCYVAEFHGVQAHAVAGPWQGRSALAAARKFLDLIDARRECFTPDIRVNSIIQDGGRAPNIIPDYARIRMEFRTDSKAKLEAMDETVRKCAQGAAMALDCTVSFTPGLQDFADMVRVAPLEDAVSSLLESLGETVNPVAPPNGSSDVGNVSYRCPTIQPLLAITPEQYALHTVNFREATDMPEAYAALERGATALVMLSLRVLGDEAFRRQVRDAYQAALTAKLKV